MKDTLGAIKRPDGSAATNNLEKAEILRDVFASTYPSTAEIAERARRPARHLQTPADLQVVEDVDTSSANLARHLQKLANKRSETPDGISAFVYKQCGPSVCEPLSLIFRRSLEDGAVPDVFRRAIISPVHKKGATNKRPVSLTSVPCKLLESIIAEAIYTNADRQRLISREQFAYRPGYSSVLQLLETQNDWALWLNDKKPFDCIYFDFKSAFETVTHSKLLEILPAYGVGAKLVNWISAFLKERSFRVRVNDCLSSTAYATSGCPQGTILGPLMYILYTDSIKHVIPSHVHTKIYADDIKMYKEIVDRGQSAAEFQAVLDDFSEWTKCLDLSHSVNKCAVLHFGHANPEYSYTLGGETLRTTNTMKDLGVSTCTTLKYSGHITEAVSNASRKINWILRTFVLKDAKLYVKLYMQYVIPAMLYASPVWNTCLVRDRNLIRKMHNKFLRRVAYRCNIEVCDIQCDDILQMLDRNDRKVFEKVCEKEERSAPFFTRVQTTTRSGINLQPKATAKRTLVNNLFAWRVSRKVR